jgi:hypothetical protein
MSVKLPGRSALLPGERVERSVKTATNAPVVSAPVALLDEALDSFTAVATTSSMRLAERVHSVEHPSQWGLWTAGLDAPAWQVPQPRSTLQLCGDSIAAADVMSMLRALAA